MTDAITIQNPRNRGGSTGHVLAKRSVTFTEIRTKPYRGSASVTAGIKWYRSVLGGCWMLGFRRVIPTAHNGRYVQLAPSIRQATADQGATAGRHSP